MTPYILILFILMPNQAQASVRIQFSSQATCVAAARDTSSALKAQEPKADVVWSCVKQ